MPQTKQLTKPEIQALFERWHAADPEPKGELNHENPYQLLVAVALSAQMTDVGVNKATKDLFEQIKTPQKMLALGEEALKGFIKTINYYPTKAARVMAMSEQLIAQHGGEVPNDQKALEALPGVGRKTANVVRNMAFGEPTMAVDTHVFRVANRTGLAPGKDVVAVEEKLLKKVPKVYLQHGHHWLILHGRYTCLARKPKCAECLVADVCGFKEKVFE